MIHNNKIKELRNLIEKKLDSYINRDYVFIDLPYHPNVGDTLIAMAAKNYLKRFKYKCLYYSSEFTFDNRYIAPDTLIIFNGGGNFGDLWQNYTVFRNMIIKKYPKNHFIILPQSVYYLDDNHLKEDIEVYSKSSNITICARDRQSFDFLKQHFVNNNVLLVPDMAFYSDLSLFKPIHNTNRILFLKRKDKEFVNNAKYDIVPQNCEVHDWPTLERTTIPYWINRQLNRFCKHIVRHFSQKFAWRIKDIYWQKILHPYNIKSGFNFVNRYDTVYTTRLHVAVIAFMLGKKVFFFDNNYHKNSALYHTWLEDADNIQLIS